MSAQGHGHIDPATTERLLAVTGVWFSAQEVDRVTRSLERIQDAAAALLQSLPFDATSEQFYRLLESDADEAGR
jgi:hypothetical protein